MTHPLHLTKDEQKLFDALPAKLKEGWEVKEENGKYEDTDKKRMLRIAFVKVSDPRLKNFQQKASAAKTPEELFELAQSINLAEVSSADLAELFFAMGSGGLTTLVSASLSGVKIDQDLNGIAFLSTIRNEFYRSSLAIS